jgi:hypothetical protein
MEAQKSKSTQKLECLSNGGWVKSETSEADKVGGESNKENKNDER